MVTLDPVIAVVRVVTAIDVMNDPVFCDPEKKETVGIIVVLGLGGNTMLIAVVPMEITLVEPPETTGVGRALVNNEEFTGEADILGGGGGGEGIGATVVMAD